MCKLLGLSFQEDPARFMTQYYLRHFFATFGPTEPHGWGFSFYDSANRAVLFKEPVPAPTSPSLRFLLDTRAIQSNYVIAHVRLRSIGPIVHHLTQPFVENNTIMVHNGTLSGVSAQLDTTNESDSLYMFKGLLKIPKEPRAVMSYLKKMNHEGAMSVLISDGTYLLAYRDKRGTRPLHYRRIKGGYLVCSLPMESKKRWKQIAPGCAMLFVNGQLVDIMS